MNLSEQRAVLAEIENLNGRYLARAPNADFRRFEPHPRPFSRGEGSERLLNENEIKPLDYPLKNKQAYCKVLCEGVRLCQSPLMNARFRKEF